MDLLRQSSPTKEHSPHNRLPTFNQSARTRAFGKTLASTASGPAIVSKKLPQRNVVHVDLAIYELVRLRVTWDMVGGEGRVDWSGVGRGGAVRMRVWDSFVRGEVGDGNSTRLSRSREVLSP